LSRQFRIIVYRFNFVLETFAASQTPLGSKTKFMAMDENVYFLVMVNDVNSEIAGR